MRHFFVVDDGKSKENLFLEIDAYTEDDAKCKLYSYLLKEYNVESILNMDKFIILYAGTQENITVLK